MTEQEMQQLTPGDVIQSRLHGLGYIVPANYGQRVTAVQTADVTNPDEWTLIRKVVSA